jgi:hypothetical protein
MKRVLATGLFLAVSVCFAQTTPPADSGQAAPAAEAKPAAAPTDDAKPETAAPAAEAAPGGKFNPAAAILMLSNVPYADASKIQPEVLQECTALGRQLADSTEKYGKEKGLQLVRSATVDPAKGGQVLVVSIVSVMSTRAFTAHTKSVALRAELYSDGKLVQSYAPSRNSGGGVFGAYTSSCGVLERTVNTLGSDLANWMKNLSR